MDGMMVGTYKRMHFHTWDNQQWQPRNTWLTSYEAINNINRVMMQIEAGSLPLTEQQALPYKAELRTLRGLMVIQSLCDSHGNIPLVTKYSDELPVQKTRTEIYNFIITEITESLPNLSATVDKNNLWQGKLNGQHGNYWLVCTSMLKFIRDLLNGRNVLKLVIRLLPAEIIFSNRITGILLK